MAPIKYPQLQDREWLASRYVEQTQSADNIAQELGCTKYAVYHALKKHGIEKRAHTSRFPQLNDKEWLREHYVDKRLSLPEIAELVGSTVGNVHAHLKSAGIPTRDRKEGLRRDAEGRVVRAESKTRNASIRKAYEERALRGERIAGPQHHHWKGGRVQKGQYIVVYAPDHPRAKPQNPYIQEHVLVMEKELGRFLDRDEIVHHRNHIKTDNRPENLEVKTRAQHISEHWAEGRRVAQMASAFETVVCVMGHRISYLEQLLRDHGINPEE